MNFSKEKAQAYLKKKDEQNNSSAVNSDNVSFNAEKARAYLSDNEGKPVRQYTMRFDASDTGASDSGYSPRMKESYDSFLSGREKSKPMPEAVKSQIGDLQKQIDTLTGKISFAQENYDTVGAKSFLEQQRQLQTKLYQLQADNAESEYDRYMAQYKLHNQSFRKLLDGDGSGATSEDYRNYLENDKMAVSAKDNAEMIDYITKYADKERKDNFGGQFAANYDVGKINEDSAIAWDEYLSDPTEENLRKAEALSFAAQEYQNKNAAALDDENAVLPWITKSLANYLPQFVNQQAMQIPLGIITAVATLNPANYKYGATVGSGVYSYRTMRGTAFRSLVEAGVPEEKARAAANDEAVISSMIEMGETFLSLSAFGMNKLSGGAVGNVGAKIAGALESKLPSSAARALLKAGKALAAYGINIFSESQEERSQEAVSIANENRDYTQNTGIGDLAYAALKKYIGGFSGSGATEEEIARMKESEAEGAKLAAMLGGVETAQAAILNGKLNASAKRYNSDVSSMIEEGMESPEGTKSRKYAEEAKKKVDSGKTLSGYQIRELAEANKESILSQDVGKITKAVEKQLTDRGYDGGNTQNLAAAIAKTVAGQETTRAERNAIKSSEQAKQILQEIAGASDVVQKYAESGAAYQVADQKAELAGEQLEQAQNDVSMQTDFQTAAENFRAADEKRTAAKEAFDAAQNEYENGSTAWARSIGARVVGDGVLSENSVEGYAHLFGKHAKLFTEAYEDGQDARQYTIEFAKAYNEGTKGGNLQALIDSGSLQNLSTVQINAAYQAGLDARNSLNTRRDTDGLHLRQSSIWENGANSTADVQEVEANAEQDQKRNADSGRKTAAEKASGFTAEKAYRRVTTLEELGVKDAKAGIKVTQVSSDYSDETSRAYEMCAQNGVKCVFFTGGYLQTKDGIIARGANKGGVVYIRADDPNFTANEIAGHEIGHELVNRGSLDMDAVISEVRKEYTKEELSKIIDDYGLDFLADGMNEDELTDMVLEEIVCDSLGGMNAFASNRDGNAEFVQKLQGLAEKHYTGKAGEGTDTQKRSTNAATDSSQKLSTVTEAQDSEYMELAKDPEKNRAKLESMVWDAAEKAGYKGMYYHGSKKGGGFTKFRDWQYFTQNRDYAKRYSDRGNDASLYSVFVKMDNLFDTRNAEERAKFADARLEYGLSELQENGLPDWTDGYDLVDYIEENGLPYDSIVLDEGGDLVNGKPVSRGLSYVVRKSSQIKSAEPVTYDNNGDVIPLSRRFDQLDEDIRYSTVNSTQLALENPDVYDEIQVTFDEILQKTKGKDLEAALLEEAQKHREDLQMWEHEAAVLTKLWKQSEKNEAKLSKALSERRDRIAEVSEELRERRRDVRTMENEFVRVVREWEKQTGKLEGKTNEAASLKQALKDSIREHRQDNAAWEREYDRLLKMYERNDRKIDRLAADIAHRKELAAKGVEERKRTVIRKKILDLNKDFQKILDHPGKGYTAHAPRGLITPIAEFCGMFADAEYGYRTNQLNQAIESGNSQERIDQIARAQSLLADISNRYAKLSKESGLAGASYTQETADQIARATELISDMFDYRNIHEMSSDELTVVYNAMKSIMHSIKTANRLISMETTRTLVETVDRFNKNIDEATPASRMSAKYAQRYLMWQMSPHEFFQYICGYAKDNVGLDIDRMFKRGTEKMVGVQRDFDNLFNPILNQDDKEIRRMTSTKEKDLVTVGLKDRNGNEVKLTRGMRLSVYMMLSQEDGLRSIAYGGFALPRIEEYYHGNISAAYGGEDIERLYTASQGGTIYEAAKTLQSLKEELKEARDDAQRKSLRQSVSAAQERLDSLVAGEEARLIRMREDIWDSFSDYEKQLVDAANQWMEHSGNLMQETYYELNGFDPVRVNHYWPIHRDPTTIQSLDTTSVANEINLANSGFTKERVKAKNPILLTDFFQELMSSKQKMSRYYGFAVAQRDFNKLYMFKSTGNGVSVKKRIMAKFQSGTYKIGVSAEQYIDNYLKSVSGANKADSSWLSDLYSRSAGATLTANARVALSQLASIPTAAAVVGWKNAAIGFSRGIGYALSKQAKDQLAGDSVWFYQRYKGEGSTREIADMRNSGGLAAKVMNSGFARKYLNWCQNMDVLATGPIMWEMAKSSVLETGMKETDPGFKAAVQDKYADIIRFSQPNYTETERSDLLRDKRVGSKILTMYKTQSNQNLNILVGASLELRKMKSDFKAGKNGVTAADVKAATAKCVSAYTAVAIGNTVLFPIMRFIGNLIIRNMKPYKDDETGEATVESVMDGILKDAFSSMAGTVAMGSILYDGVYAVLSGERYYGISDNAVGLLSDTLTSMVTLGQSVTSGKNVTDKAVKMLLNLASSFGIPAKNLKNLATAAYGWANQLLTGGPNVFDATDTTSAQDNARFVSAVLADNEEKAGNELSYLISKSDEPNLYLQSKDAASNVKSYLKDQFEERRISEDDATKVLRYLEYEDEDIEASIKQWKCVVETGIKYGNIGKSVMKGIITEDYAVELYMTYGGLSESKAMDKVYGYVFDQTYPKLSDLSETAKLKFRTASESGISAEVFATAYRACSGGKKKDIVNYIMSIRGLTIKQRKALWDAVKGQSTDKDTPFA